MNITKNSFAKYSITSTFVAALAIMASFSQPAFSQTNDIDEDAVGFPSFSSDASQFRGSLNPLDLIHRSRLGNDRSAEQFQEDSNQNLDNAADDFKRQRQLLLQQQLESEANSNPNQ